MFLVATMSATSSATPPVKPHSRRASLDVLAPTAPCLVDFASQKQQSVVFARSPKASALPTALHPEILS